MSAPIGPGDWVICVDASTRNSNGPTNLTVGGIYRVEWVGVVPSKYRDAGLPIVRLQGVPKNGGAEGFYLDRFRPAGRGGMFDELLKADPVKIGEPA